MEAGLIRLGPVVLSLNLQLTAEERSMLVLLVMPQLRLTCAKAAALPDRCRNCRARLEQHNSRRRKVFATSQGMRRGGRVGKDRPFQVPSRSLRPAVLA